MYLSNLELVGFKSFAQKTSFKFTDGITVFVGPNGCGKTNIVDAVRWVLGEQKTSLLRSDIMENIIFCGTKHRKPIGMAEVSITIQNNKKILPIEFTEVTITRRLFRNGESQYLINNTICRLRDILDLFMDTGIGSDSYSVIELKMVEGLLSGRVEERRHLLEEAAGVTKYKIRRKEADKKLFSVQSDLIRLQDITEEVKKNVSSLSRQAAKTKKYNQYIDEFKKLELDLLKHQYMNINFNLVNQYKDLNIKRSEKNNYHKIIQDLESDINNLDEEIVRLNEQHTIARNIETKLTNELSQMNKDYAVGHEKKLAFIASSEKLSKDIIDINNNIESLQNNKKQLQEILNSLSNEYEIKSFSVEKQKIIVNELRNSVNSVRHSTNEKSEVLKNIKNSIISAEASIKKNAQRYTLNNQRIEDGKKEIEALRTQVYNLEQEYIKYHELKEKLKIEKDNISEEYQKNYKLKNSYSKSIEEIQQNILEIKNEIGLKKSSHDFLKNLVSSDESTKFLIETNNWISQTEKSTLAEIVATDVEFRLAIEASLGDTGKWFVVNNNEQARSAYLLLNKNHKGKATFIVLNDIPKINEFESQIYKGKSIKWISEIVRTDPEIRNVLRLILGKTCIVNSLEEAIEIVNNGIVDAAVTLDGDVIKKNGIFRWGSIIEGEGQLIGKKERILTLEKEISSLQVELSHYEISLLELKDKHSSIDLNEIDDRIKIINEQINENEQLLSQIKYKKESFNNKIELIDGNSAQFLTENSQLDEENKKLEKLLKELNSQQIIFNEELEESNSALYIEEENLEQQESELHIQDIEIAKLQTEIKNIENDIIKTGNQIKFNNDRLLDIEHQHKQAIIEIANLNRRLSIISEELIKIESSNNEATGKREFLSQEIGSKQEQLRHLTENLISERKVYSRIVENMHQIEIKISEYNTQLSILSQKSNEDYQTDLEQISIELDENFSIEDTKAKLIVLKEKLNSLGNVNFMALEEYEEQSQRLEFLTTQTKDLIDSEKTLQDTISEINRTAEEMFGQTFNKINENFKKLFKKLFGNDGDAEIHLIDGDLLEANVEIIAKPPGKKPHSIDVLSGGEKTLIAIALLFSIYLVKPSPFCILDEVDAPLDDSNIDKYLDLIRTFSDNTQFLVITHNKKTMEAADTLYGITMQEEGLSQVVSVKFSSVN